MTLGRGMFSNVVKARDTKRDTDVAIKIIRNNSVMYKAGMKEYDILKRLKEIDPEDKFHVIQCHCFFIHKQHLCLVFDSMRFELNQLIFSLINFIFISMNLRDVLKKFGTDVGLNVKAVKIYAKQLLLSLSLLRRTSLIHADIKPDNILTNENMNILKLSDLGSASSIEENDITPYLVSRYYRAPEISMLQFQSVQISNIMTVLGSKYDYAIDMWSLGITLYELFTGKILFPGKSNNQMLKYMMEFRGKIPPKLLRRGQFMSKHFDELYNFVDTSGDSVRIIATFKQSKDMKSRLLGTLDEGSEEERNTLVMFADLLDKMLVINPEKRITVKEALMHSFIQYI